MSEEQSFIITPIFETLDDALSMLNGIRILSKLDSTEPEENVIAIVADTFGPKFAQAVSEPLHEEHQLKKLKLVSVRNITAGEVTESWRIMKVLGPDKRRLWRFGASKKLSPYDFIADYITMKTRGQDHGNTTVKLDIPCSEDGPLKCLLFTRAFALQGIETEEIDHCRDVDTYLSQDS